MRLTPRPFDAARDAPDDAGFRRPLTWLAAEQRDSLCRGVAFILFLTLSCLLIVYAPLIVGDPDWAAAGVLSTHTAAQASFAGRMRIVPTR